MANKLNLSLSTEVDIPHVDAEIVPIDELEEMTLDEVNRAKNQLRIRKQKLQLQVDSHKLKQATTIVNRMDKILDVMLDKLCAEDVNALDVKSLTDAYKNMLSSLNSISRLDSIDGTGRATKLVLEVRDMREV